MRVFLESTTILVIFVFISFIWVIYWGSIYFEIGIDIEREGIITTMTNYFI